MAADKIRWGILGVAKINQRLLPAFKLARNADLCAIASRSTARAQEAASAAGIIHAYGNYDSLLQDQSIDAVYIPLPNSLHAEWVLKAADHGKHVLCEKPLAPTASEARKIIDGCRARGIHLMDGFMWPHHPRTARLRQVLEDGVIGEVRRVTSAFTYRMEALDSANIRLQPELGGGSLLDVGCYPVYGIRWAFGAEPLKVYANAEYVLGVDVSMSGLLIFEGGRIGAFDCGFTLPYRGQLEITGTKGIVRVPNLWLPSKRATFEIWREGQTVEEVVLPGEDQIVCMLENFGKAVLEGQPIQPAAEEAERTLRVLDALTRAAREGKEENVGA